MQNLETHCKYDISRTSQGLRLILTMLLSSFLFALAMPATAQAADKNLKTVMSAVGDKPFATCIQKAWDRKGKDFKDSKGRDLSQRTCAADLKAAKKGPKNQATARLLAVFGSRKSGCKGVALKADSCLRDFIANSVEVPTEGICAIFGPEKSQRKTLEKYGKSAKLKWAGTGKPFLDLASEYDALAHLGRYVDRKHKIEVYERLNLLEAKMKAISQQIESDCKHPGLQAYKTTTAAFKGGWEYPISAGYPSAKEFVESLWGRLDDAQKYHHGGIKYGAEKEAKNAAVRKVAKTKSQQNAIAGNLQGCPIPGQGEFRAVINHISSKHGSVSKKMHEMPKDELLKQLLEYEKKAKGIVASCKEYVASLASTNTLAEVKKGYREFYGKKRVFPWPNAELAKATQVHLETNMSKIKKATAAYEAKRAALEDSCFERLDNMQSKVKAWLKCMSSRDLTYTARKYALTDQSLYRDHMKEQAYSCGKNTGYSSTLRSWLKKCDGVVATHLRLDRYEFTPTFKGDYGYYNMFGLTCEKMEKEDKNFYCKN